MSWLVDTANTHPCRTLAHTLCQACSWIDTLYGRDGAIGILLPVIGNLAASMGNAAERQFIRLLISLGLQRASSRFFCHVAARQFRAVSVACINTRSRGYRAYSRHERFTWLEVQHPTTIHDRTPYIFGVSTSQPEW